MPVNIAKAATQGSHAEVYGALERLARGMVDRSRIVNTRKEDAVGDLVLAGFKGIQIYSEGLDAVVRQCMANRLRDLLRRQRTRPPEVLVPFGNEAAENANPLVTESHEERVVDKHAAKQFVQMMLDLPWLTPRQKQVLVAVRDYDGDRRAVAELLGITERAVSSTLAYIGNEMKKRGVTPE